MRRMIALAGVSVAGLLAGPVDAAPLNFAITGPYTASWVLDSQPKPNFVDGGYTFSLYDVPGNYGGASGPLADLTFYNDRFEGGIAINDFRADDSPDDNYLLVTTGPQLYSGTEFNPVFHPGTFQLTDYYNSNSYTLMISALTGTGVPEPVTWTMMILGFGMAGVAMRRRPRLATA